MEKLITDVITEPVSLSLLKEHLRIEVDDTTEDTILNVYIGSARKYAETYTGKIYGLQTWKLIIRNYYEIITFPFYPVNSITSIKYLDDDETEQTLSTDDYSFDSDFQEITIPESFLTSKISIEVSAGETPVKTVEAAILLLAGHLYENREATTDVKNIAIKYGLDNLLNTDRIF